jgi:hypothetical protein
LLDGPARDLTSSTPEWPGTDGKPADEVLLAVDQVDGWEGLGNAGCDGRGEEHEILEARHIVRAWWGRVKLWVGAGIDVGGVWFTREGVQR